MALVDLVKDKNIPKPDSGPQDNISTQSPNGAGIDTRRQPNLIDQAKTVNPLGSPQGRHFDNGRTILPQGSPMGRHSQSPLGKGSLRKSPLAGE